MYIPNKYQVKSTLIEYNNSYKDNFQAVLILSTSISTQLDATN